MRGMKPKKVTVDEVFSATNFEEMKNEYGAESGNPTLKAFEPDYETYKELEKQGRLFASAVVNDEGELIALVSIVLAKIPHFNALFASVESIWAREDGRKKGLGLRMLFEAKRLAREKGAKGLYIGSRCDSRFEKLLDLVAKPMNKVYWVEL